MRLAIAIILGLLSTTVQADPEPYRLDTARSDVGFTYLFQGEERAGKMPVLSANMLIDLDNVPASKVAVTLDAQRAQAGFVFATGIMRGPDILDTANHPTIRFQSTAIEGDLRGARVSGLLTVRGVTRPVTLDAGLYRQRGTDPDDRDNLLVLLTGEIDRIAFGAGGFPGYVGPVIKLRIVARITR
jgi:polyisoprenoid-binding protein YceI